MLAFVLILIAVILFILAASAKLSTNYNVTALGLAFFAGAFLVQAYPG